MSAFATIGMIGLQFLVSLAVIVFFRRSGVGSTWATKIAPAPGRFGLLIVPLLLIQHLPTPGGSGSLYLLLLPIAMLVVRLLGMAIQRLRFDGTALIGRAVAS